MRFEFETLDTLARLAWVATLRRGARAVHVLHGPWVETRGQHFFEGAWDGPVERGALDEAITFAGSGGRVDGERVTFVGATHKFERLQSVRVADTLYVSNSLALLLAHAGERLDFAYPDYFHDFLEYYRVGIRIKRKPMPLESGRAVYLHDCCNVIVAGDLTVRRAEKRVPAPFGSYVEYAEFLERTAAEVAANAADPVRTRTYRPLAAVSRGYDSVAVAALASRANCRHALTFRRSGPGHVEDSGAEIARHLRMEVKEFERMDYTSLPGLPEVEFYQNVRLPTKTFTLCADDLSGSLFFNGQGGEDYWGTGDSVGMPLLQEPSATTMSGSNFTEFRLRAGFIFFPLACSGAIHAPALSRLSRSRDLAPWSVGGDYDRPIPRRLAEERGVPRELFGQQKVGGGPQVGAFGLGPASDADFREFYRERVSEAGATSRIRLLHLRFHRRHLPLFLMRALVASVRPNTLAENYTFHWGLCRLQERYAAILKQWRGPG